MIAVAMENVEIPDSMMMKPLSLLNVFALLIGQEMIVASKDLSPFSVQEDAVSMESVLTMNVSVRIFTEV